MKEKIIMIIFLISIILIICLAIFGFKVGKIEIPSISQLIEKNNGINQSLETVTKLTSDDYPKSVSKLKATTDSLKVQKEKYEQLAGLNSEENPIYETEEYDIGYLWTTLGKYATKHKINLAMDVKESSGTNLYNLNFTVQGEYVDISSFITAIENDSNLMFRIYNFKIAPGASTINLKATFTVKDVNIDDSTLIKKTNSLADTIKTNTNTNTVNQTNTVD